MLESLLNLRASPVIMFVGAFVVIFLIKASTLLLPAQYYFSFSKLVSGDRGPFMVDPPSVSGKKMCALLKKYGVTTQDIQAGQVNCSLDRINAKAASGKPGRSNFNNEQIDFIYGVALSGDKVILDGGRKIIRDFRFAPMSDEQFEKIASSSPTVISAQRAISEHYTKQINRRLKEPIRKYLNKRFEAYKEPTEGNQPHAGNSNPEFAPLSDEARSKLKQLSTQTASQLNAVIGQLQLNAIGKTKVDTILDGAYGKWDVLGRLTDYYGNQVEDWTRSNVRAAVTASNLLVQNPEEAKKAIFTEMSQQGLEEYAMSVAIRLAPVLLFGFILGFMFGPREFLSIGLAAALAAFLLSWPLMLLWENLVGYQWQDQKPLFLVFYAVYALSFFVTARFAAVFGAFIRTLFGGADAFGASSSKDGAQTVVGWKSLALNLISGLAVNGIVYAWNIVIPLAAT